MDLNNPYDVLSAYFPGEITLGVSQRYPKDLCREKRIVFTKPHYRAFSFRREDLDAWLEQYRMHRQ